MKSEGKMHEGFKFSFLGAQNESKEIIVQKQTVRKTAKR